MKRLIFIYFLFVVLLPSCSKKEIPTCENCSFTCIAEEETDVLTNDCIDNWQCTFKVIPQSQVAINEGQGVGSGDKNVFQMHNSTQGHEAIADDELVNILVFELDESQNSFSVEDKDLAEMQVHYITICFCLDVEFKPVTSGCLQGEKQADGTWWVAGNLNATSTVGDVEVKFEAQFE